MVNLVFIHGRDQQGKEPDALKQEWVGAFKEGLAENGLTFPEDVKVVMPYYGDLLAGLLAGIVEATASLIKRGEGEEEDNDDKSQFIYEYLSQVIQQAGITQEQIAEVEAEASLPDMMERGVCNWAPVRQLMKVADRFKLVRESVIEWMTSDVHHYLTSYKVTEEINRFVVNQQPAPCRSW